MRAVLSVDTSALLPKIVVPSLYLRAKQDRLVPQAALEHIKALLPSIAVATIDAPHCLLQANPAAASAAIRTFMRELEA